ncbi:PTS sugar transporter subunit IIC [Enterococcus sp. LJL120]
MDKLSNVGDFFGKFAVKLNQNRYLSAIKNSFIAIIPFTIVGSVTVLFGSVIFGSAMLGGVSGLEFLQELAPLFTSINYGTMNIMALMVAYYIGKNLASEFQTENTVYAGIVSLASFVILSPTQLTTEIDGVSQVISNVISVDSSGSKGLFIALVAGLISTRIYIGLMNVEKLKIRLPEQVPPNVSKSFTSLIPTLFVLFIMGILGFVFEKITGMTLSSLITAFLQIPLEAMMQHPLGIVGATLFAHFLWFFGIHGSSIVNGLTDPMLLSALAVNTELVAQGLEPTEVVTRPFWNMYATLGGSGCTIALLVGILLISKRADEKAITKLSLGPGLFGINEPVIFGIPIVLNPIYAIPFILAPTVSVIIGYVATSIGFASPAFVSIPWSMPPIVNGFIATGGDIGAVVTQIICLVVTFFIYLPFVKISSNQYLKSLEQS